MRKIWLVVGSALMWGRAASADVILYHDDLSSVSGWTYVWQSQPDAGPFWFSDGSNGMFSVLSNSAAIAYSPVEYLAFDSNTWSAATLSFAVSNISGSMSYQVGFDQFDASSNYLSALTIHPDGTFVGNTNHALQGFSWDANTKLVKPKVTISTGLGNQQMELAEMDIVSTIPEPTTLAMLVGAGLAAVAIRRSRKK
ncbi:MAG: PEP-CTERM sorting domain-containing protein [Verrucomicrobiota bacterium]